MRGRSIRSMRGLAIAMFPLLMVFTSTAVLGQARVVLGPADFISIDQPRVTMELIDANGNVDGPGTELLGLPFYSDAILDTGANGILVGKAGYSFYNDDFELVTEYDRYDVATRSDSSVVQYPELGVAGVELLNVFQPYTVRIATAGGSTQQLTNFNAFGSPSVDISDWAAIVGMPAMAGKIVTMDLAPMAVFDQIDVNIGAAAPPPVTPTSYHVNLRMLPAEHYVADPLHPQTYDPQPGDPQPTYADLPLVDGVTVRRGSASSTGTVLLDTGAMTSIISSSTAAALGMDLEAHPELILDVLEVGGIGGIVEVPVVQLDAITIPTREGIPLVLTDLQVAIVDIPGIGGILGMNILTSGYYEAAFGLLDFDGAESDTPLFDNLNFDLLDILLDGMIDPTLVAHGYFDQLVMDFASSTPTLRLDVNPDYHNLVIPEPGTMLLLAFGGLAILYPTRKKGLR